MNFDQLVPPPFPARGLALICPCESYFDSSNLFSYMVSHL